MSVTAHGSELGRSPSTGLLGTAFFLIAQAMLFIGLVFVTLAIRRGSVTWPPPGTPPLDLGLLGLNTVLLIVSSLTMHRAASGIRHDDRPRLKRWLTITTALGLAFLVGQVWEFQRVGGWRLATDGIYQTLFDTLTGLHGLHVAAGVAFLVVVLARARMGHFSQRRHLAVTAAESFWYFVTAVWLVVFFVLIVP